MDGVVMSLSNTVDLNFDSAINWLLVEEPQRKNSGNYFGDAMTVRDVLERSKSHGNLVEEEKSSENCVVMSVIFYENLKHH